MFLLVLISFETEISNSTIVTVNTFLTFFSLDSKPVKKFTKNTKHGLLARLNLSIVAKNDEYFIWRQVEQSQFSCVYLLQVNIIRL